MKEGNGGDQLGRCRELPGHGKMSIVLPLEQDEDACGSVIR
jgi:hypothetical protein